MIEKKPIYSEYEDGLKKLTHADLIQFRNHFNKRAKSLKSHAPELRDVFLELGDSCQREINNRIERIFKCKLF